MKDVVTATTTFVILLWILQEIEQVRRKKSLQSKSIVNILPGE